MIAYLKIQQALVRGKKIIDYNKYISINRLPLILQKTQKWKF